MNSKAWHLLSDPVTLVEAVWSFHSPQLIEKGFDEESFSDAIDESVMPELRERFIHACAGFFPLVTTFSTMLQGLQPGSPSFERAAKVVAQTLRKDLATP